MMLGNMLVPIPVEVIMIPAGLGLGPGGWTLCEASVVRVEGPSEDKGLGIAATLDRIALMPEIG